MAFLSAASSSGTKPCVHHTSAVFGAALAIKGRASVPPAAKPRELRSTERRLRFAMSVSFPVLAPRGTSAGVFCLDKLKWPGFASSQPIYQPRLTTLFQFAKNGVAHYPRVETHPVFGRIISPPPTSPAFS